jgi:hypothetical protein
MLGYLLEPKERLRALRAGMSNNSTNWTVQTVEVQAVDAMITNLDAKDAEVDLAKQTLSLKSSEARELGNAAVKLANKIENLALGFYSGKEEKLIEYGIKSMRTYTTKPAPTKTLMIKLEDDTDGEGFIVSTQKDPNADYYEWQKGYGSNAADDKTIPELKNFKTTKKTSFVDDEVPKGVRVFYRVRAANTNGAGPWSEAVSKVQ